MFIRVAVAVISFWSLLASAADWQDIADTKLGQLKLDRASVSNEGKITTAVLVYEFKVYPAEIKLASLCGVQQAAR